jgi:hypothetical protein
MDAEPAIDPRFRDYRRIAEAMRRGAQRAVWEHKQLGYPICTWRGGQVAWIPPEEIEIEKPPED